MIICASVMRPILKREEYGDTAVKTRGSREEVEELDQSLTSFKSLRDRRGENDTAEVEL